MAEPFQSMFASDLFAGQTCIVTGGGSGIGLRSARELRRLGANIAICGRNTDKLEAARAVLNAETGPSDGVVAKPCDIREPEQVSAFVAAVMDQFGRVDVLVNNAGVSVGSTLEEHTLDDFEWLVGINVWGVVYGCKFFLPLLQRSDDAFIVNLSSMFGLIGIPGQSSYCLSKFAVRGFSEAIAVELADSPVRVMSVHPGGIATNIAKNMRWSEGQDAARSRAIRFFERRAMSPDTAATKIIEGLREGASRKLIAPEAFVTDVVKRVFPVLPRTMLARVHAWFNGER